MRSGRQAFALKPQLFDHFLAGAETCIDDLDFFARLEAGEPDHISGQVVDLDVFPHIQDKDLSATAHGGGLQYQLHSLRDQHEVSLRIRVGNGDRAAAPDLLFKGWKHATVAAQNIAESDGHKASVLMLQAKHDKFGNSLRRSHDVGRFDSFVGRDHYE